MLLLNTLRASADWDGWERRLLNQLKKAAHDDATVLLAPLGFGDIEAAREAFAPRRAALQGSIKRGRKVPPRDKNV